MLKTVSQTHSAGSEDGLAFFGHMNTAIEVTNCPNRRHPRQHESPARRPCSEVFSLSEDIFRIISLGGEVLADGKCDHGCRN